MIEIVAWILAISAITLIGAEYARRFDSSTLLVALFTTFILLSEIIAVKLAKFELLGYPIFAPAAVLIFSVTFLLTDIVNEKFGRMETHKMIFITFVCLLAMMFFIQIASIWPNAPFWANSEAWNKILGLVPRITIASMIAYLVSENFDAWSFAKLKEKIGKHLWIRNAFSSIPALGLDTIIFITIAFYGTMPVYQVYQIIQGQFILKWLTAVIDIPFMYLARYRLGVKSKPSLTGQAYA